MNIQQAATIITLQKMFNYERGWLDICALQDLWKLHNITVDTAIVLSLRLMHCVHWNEVPTEVRVLVLKEVLKTLGMEAQYKQLANV